MDIRWTKNIADPEQKENFNRVLMNNQISFGRLKELIIEFEAELDIQEFSVSDFEAANWAEKQAFRNGQRSALRKIKDLLNFVK